MENANSLVSRIRVAESISYNSINYSFSTPSFLLAEW